MNIRKFQLFWYSIIYIHIGLSKHGGTPKIIHFNRIFHYKPSILGYPHFTKPPYILSAPRILGGGRLQFQLSPCFTHRHAHASEAQRRKMTSPQLGDGKGGFTMTNLGISGSKKLRCKLIMRHGDLSDLTMNSTIKTCGFYNLGNVASNDGTCSQLVHPNIYLILGRGFSLLRFSFTPTKRLLPKATGTGNAAKHLPPTSLKTIGTGLPAASLRPF